MNRKTFMQYGSTGLLGFYIPRLSQSPASTDPLDPTIVKEFVGAGHNNLPRVKELLAEYPNLIFSRYDWGNGDFEEAIEGAGHVGDREIAEYLISQGARADDAGRNQPRKAGSGKISNADTGKRCSWIYLVASCYSWW